ncbi:hypothetical protein [Gordonia sp. KTR9]|nr:hypothetical protein [Gordonia sp. KTR9]
MASRRDVDTAFGWIEPGSLSTLHHIRGGAAEEDHATIGTSTHGVTA